MDLTVVIAAHDPRRNVSRAVRSVAVANGETAEALVVCHNTSIDSIRSSLDSDLADPALPIRFLEFSDGVRSPSGPFMRGLGETTSEWVGIMGSDDELDPGACRNWIEAASRTGANAVIARVVRAVPASGSGKETRTVVKSPPKRARRTGDLSLVRDRLAYRAAPLGMFRRSLMDSLGLYLVEGAGNGGDIPFTVRLWHGARVAYAPGPGYVEHADAPQRTTFAARGVAETLQGVTHTVNQPWFAELSPAARHAVGVKFLRANLVSAAVSRAAWTATDARELGQVVDGIRAVAPRAFRDLSRAECAVLRAALGSTGEPRSIPPLKRWRPSALVARSLGGTLSRQGPVRWAFAALMVR